jgi:hypothetical protein
MINVHYIDFKQDKTMKSQRTENCEEMAFSEKLEFFD